MCFVDQDGDVLEVKKVGGFGEPVLCVRVTQEGQESQMNLTGGQALALAEFIREQMGG